MMHIEVTLNIEMQEGVDRIVVRNPPWLRRPLPESSDEMSEEERVNTRPSSRRRKRGRNERPVSESHLAEHPALCEVADRGDGIVVDQHCQGGQGVSERGCPSSGA